MMDIYQQLQEGAKVLGIIDRRRLETGDPGLGSAVERAILDRCLADLENASNAPIGMVCDEALEDDHEDCAGSFLHGPDSGYGQCCGDTVWQTRYFDGYL